MTHNVIIPPLVGNEPMEDIVSRQKLEAFLQQTETEVAALTMQDWADLNTVDQVVLHTVQARISQPAATPTPPSTGATGGTAPAVPTTGAPAPAQQASATTPPTGNVVLPQVPAKPLPAPQPAQAANTALSGTPTTNSGQSSAGTNQPSNQPNKQQPNQPQGQPRGYTQQTQKGNMATPANNPSPTPTGGSGGTPPTPTPQAPSNQQLKALIDALQKQFDQLVQSGASKNQIDVLQKQIDTLNKGLTDNTTKMDTGFNDVMDKFNDVMDKLNAIQTADPSSTQPQQTSTTQGNQPPAKKQKEPRDWTGWFSLDGDTLTKLMVFAMTIVALVFLTLVTFYVFRDQKIANARETSVIAEQRAAQAVLDDTQNKARLDALERGQRNAPNGLGITLVPTNHVYVTNYINVAPAPVVIPPAPQPPVQNPPVTYVPEPVQSPAVIVQPVNFAPWAGCPAQMQPQFSSAPRFVAYGGQPPPNPYGTPIGHRYQYRDY